MSPVPHGKPIYPGPKSSPTHCPRCGAIFDINSQSQACPHKVLACFAKGEPRG